MVMLRLFLAVALAASVLMVVPSVHGKEKKKAPASDASTEQGVWKEVKTNSPYATVAYKLDGSYIVISFKNLSKDKTLRIRYQAKWKKGENGKWTDDASQEGLSVRLRKSDELTKDIRTYAKEIKDVVIELDISESN